MKLSSEDGMRRMLADIRAEVSYTSRMTGRDQFAEPVMHAMATVPRDEFVPEHLKQAAFDNGPLPIGHGQTISQPYIVALMTELLEPQAGQTVLEIGTGSGYQTAVLSLLYDTVYSMDVVTSLAEAAGQRLKQLHFDNIHIQAGNGYLGLAAHAPFDAIIVTAAAPKIPDALIEQLKPGGRLVIPVGQLYSPQELMLVNKNPEGEVSIEKILNVAFVPLVDREPS